MKSVYRLEQSRSDNQGKIIGTIGMKDILGRGV